MFWSRLGVQYNLTERSKRRELAAKIPQLPLGITCWPQSLRDSTGLMLVSANVFCVSYPCIFNFKRTATSINVSSIQSSFGLLCTLNRLKPGGAGSRKGHCTLQDTLKHRIVPHLARILHHCLDSVSFKDDYPQDAANGITDCVQNILDQKKINENLKN